MIERATNMPFQEREGFWNAMMAYVRNQKILFTHENEVGKVPVPEDALLGKQDYYRNGLLWLNNEMKKIAYNRIKQNVDLP